MKSAPAGSAPSETLREVRRRIFETDVFTYMKEHPSRLSQDLLTALASIIKAAAEGDAAHLTEGRAEFAAHFSGAPLAPQCGPLYDGAPIEAASYAELEGCGAPASCCPVARGGPLHQVQQKMQLEREARPTRFAFDVKRTGYIECDDEGVWDRDVTAQKTFEAHWHTRFAQLRGTNADEFLTAIPRFSRIGFFPETAEPIMQRNGISYFNKYRAPGLEPAAGDWSLYDALALHLVGGCRKAQAFLLDWTAAPLQSLRRTGKPKKMGTMVTLYPAQGSGKQLYCEGLILMYGESNSAVLDQDRLDSKFTGQLVNRLLVVLNETMSDTNRSRATANKLKAMATDTRLSGESKGIEADNIVNEFNLINCTNDPRPLLLERGDRRNTLFFQNKPLDRELGRLIAEDRLGPRAQLAAFYAHLLERDVTVKVGDLYENDAREHLLRECEASDLKFWRAVQEDGWLSVASSWQAAARRDEVREPTVDHDGKTWVPSDVARAVYVDWCQRQQLKPTGGNKLWDALKEVLPHVERGKPRQGGVQVRSWTGIPLRAPDDPWAEQASAAPALPAVDGASDNADFTDGPTQRPARA